MGRLRSINSTYFLLHYTQTTTRAILAPEGGLTDLHLIQHSQGPNPWYSRKGYNNSPPLRANVALYECIVLNVETTALHPEKSTKRKVSPLLLLTAPVVVCV